MTVAASVQFTQGATVGGAGFALIGVTGTTVVTANGNNTNVFRWVFTMLDVPPGSTVPVGVISDGPVSTISFIPDIPGCYRMQLDVYGVLNLTHSVDVRAFIVKSTRGWIYPAFRDVASELNFIDSTHPAGNARGWTTALETILKDLENVATTVVPAGGAFAINQVGASTTATSSFAYTPNITTGNPSFTVNGAGTGIMNMWPPNNTSAPVDDQFQFVNRLVTGDFEFSCRLSVTTLTALTQAGISLRETFAGNSRSLTIMFSPASSNDPLDSQARDSVQMLNKINFGIASGAGSLPAFATAVPNPPVSPYVWFKINRVGQDLGVYWSREGTIWIPLTIGDSNVSSTISRPTIFKGNPLGVNYVGFYAASQSQSATVSATFDSVYLGPIRTQHETSWIGNTFARSSSGNRAATGITGNMTGADGYVSQYAQAIWVDPTNGTVFANSIRDEQGQPLKIYKDGAIVKAFDPTRWTQTGGAEGSITGDNTYVYFYYGGGGSASGVYSYDKTALAFHSQLTFTNTIGAGGITGMACNAALNELYLSDYSNNRILVVNTSTGSEIAGRAFAFPQGHPGPIAVDARGNLWIISMPADSPLRLKVTPTRPTGIYEYSNTGTAGLSITDCVFPTSVNASPVADELWVTENGVNQNIRIYNGLTTTPVLNRTFGVTGGVYSGTNPGLIYDPAAGGWNRLYYLVAVRQDNLGNVYVVCDGCGADIRKFDIFGNLIWMIVSEGDDSFGSSDFDTSTNAADNYSRVRHNKLNLATNVPGGEWSYYSLTFNPFAPYASNDTRSIGAMVPLIRTIGGNKFMFISQATATVIHILRQSGEQWIPCGRLSTIVGGPPGTTQLWVDGNGNGLIDSGETTTNPSPNGMNGGVVYMVWDVDTRGDIWWSIGSTIMHFIYGGVNSFNVPLYSFSGGNYEEIINPAPFTTFTPINTANVRAIHYDKANDAMYIGGDTDYIVSGNHVGFSGGPGAVFARYDNWYANRLTFNPEPRWLAQLPRTEDGDGYWFEQLPFYTQTTGIWPQFKAFALANRYLFVIEEFGHVRIWDALIGNWCYSIAPGAEMNSFTSLVDYIMFRAVQTSNGQYQLVLEDSGIRGSELYYRWTPNRTPLVVPNAVTQLAAIGDNGKIRVTWTDWGKNFVDGYNIYRTISGVETKIASSVQAVKYIDTTAPTGQLISYRVTAVNAIGESPFAGPVTAHSLVASASATPTVDSTTLGAWKGVYGNLGSFVINSSVNQNFLPASVIVTQGVGKIQELLAPGTGNPSYALQSPGVGATTTELGRWYGQTLTGTFVPFTFDISITDGSTRQMALYSDLPNLGYTQTFVITDAVTGATLSTQAVTGVGLSHVGIWVVWTVSGHLRITVSENGGAPVAMCAIMIS